MTNSITLDFIGEVDSPYKEKFAIPRQPGLVSAAKGKITLCDVYNNEELVRGLSAFSHIWVVFIFHATQQQGWKPLVRPPRLGGNQKMGVLATRSTFRPNPIGMSVVKLDSIEKINKRIILNISAFDLLDKTPVIDIKPYIPYADSIENAKASYAQQQPAKIISVNFTDNARHTLIKHKSTFPTLETLIIQILSQDPRPAYKQKKDDDSIYGVSLYHFNIRWLMRSHDTIEVIEIL